MTNREKIDYLKQYQNLDKYINQLLEDCERLRARAEKITPTLTGMPQGGDGENQRELAICRLIDLNREINSKIDEFVDLGREIREKIDTVGDIRLRTILQLKYIDGLSWEKIAVELDCKWRNLHNLHPKALRELKI